MELDAIPSMNDTIVIEPAITNLYCYLDRFSKSLDTVQFEFRIAAFSSFSGWRTQDAEHPYLLKL
jgi:hypothetical protein